MDEAHLARLRDTLAVREAPQTEQLGALINVIIEAEVEKKACCGSAGSTFTRIAMNDYDVFLIGHQPFSHLVDKLNEVMKRWRMVIVPVVVGNATVEALRLVRPLRHVEHIVFVAVFLLQESFHLYLNKG